MFHENKMKNFLAIPVLLLSSAAAAQITVGSSDMPNSGDSVLVSIAADIGPNDLETSDSNYIWDYSMLVPTLQRYEVFDSPLDFTAPFNLVFNPFNTSYGHQNNLLTASAVPGLTFDEAYEFLKESATKYRQIGVGYRINGIPLPFLYSDEDVLYRFPMNFGDADTDDYAFGLPIPTIGYYGQTGHRETIVDGWGSLTTPYGTFNTLRLKSTIAAQDTLYLDSLGFGFTFPRPLRYEYKWIANGKKVPVLQVDANDVLGLPVIANVQYIDSIVPGVPMLGIHEVAAAAINSSLYPNPAADNAMLEYTLASDSDVKIILTDVMGRALKTLTNEKQQAGVYRKMIPASNLSAGTYLLVLETSSGRKVHRMIVSE
jgi:hypothetical protein